MTLADAITKLEGTNPAYNNPGAISGSGDTGTSFGAGIGIYSSLDAGEAALNQQVNSVLSGNSPYYPSSMTLQQMGTVYSGGNPTYGNNLASLIGVSPTTTLGELASQTGAPQTGVKGVLNKGMDFLDSLTGAPNADHPSGFTLPSVENIITILVGVILIAAGVFSFKNSQTVIQTVSRAAKSGVELAS